MRFTKMQGIGNDYLYVNCFEEVVEDPQRLALVMSRPHFGAGADGLVLIDAHLQCRWQRSRNVRQRHPLHRQICV